MKRQFMLLAVAAFLVTNVYAQDVKVEKGKIVKFDYTLKVDGKEVESSAGKEPLSYSQGIGEIIPGLETALEGMKVGEQKNVKVEPKDAYGDVIKDAVKEIPNTSFPKDFVPTVGMVVDISDGKGMSAPAVIAEVKESSVMVDFNHPLAGKTLEFDVKIVDIQDAPAVPAVEAQAPAATTTTTTTTTTEATK